MTILVFVGLQAAAAPLGFLLSPPEKTERADGSRIVVGQKTSAMEQLRRLWGAVSTRKIGLLLPIFFSSWFYWVSFGFTAGFHPVDFTYVVVFGRDTSRRI